MLKQVVNNPESLLVWLAKYFGILDDPNMFMALTVAYFNVSGGHTVEIETWIETDTFGGLSLDHYLHGTHMRSWHFVYWLLKHPRCMSAGVTCTAALQLRCFFRGKLEESGIIWATSGLQSPRRTPPSHSPNLNTLIMLDMHRFGVAALHQLRGRVGRGGVQAHAYLMHLPLVELKAKTRSQIAALGTLGNWAHMCPNCRRDPTVFERDPCLAKFERGYGPMRENYKASALLCFEENRCEHCMRQIKRTRSG